ncbi:MAG: tryptophan-rich sensory protein [Chloroflexi bacterium]|nr:tryptophan-rich sensory protein [Chloroflexota bacterium]
MIKDIVRQVLVIVATIATLTVNTLAQTLPINNLTPQEISDAIPALFTPAGYVFGIWSIIYLGMIGYTIYQALPAQRENELLRKIAPFYLLSSVGNIGWILLWHYLFITVSMAAMLLLLVSLIGVYVILHRDDRRPENNGERILVYPVFSVYLAWVSVATIANASAVLFNLEWGAFGISHVIWTNIMVFIAMGLGATFLFSRFFDVAYALVLIWSFVGIAVRHAGTYDGILIPVGMMAGALGLMIVIAYFMRQSSSTPSPQPTG